MDPFQKIKGLKKSLNAVLLAHYYQEPDIQDVADFIGDSLQLAREAAKTKAEVIVFCGVHFMAETAKILNPDRTVVVPDLEAGCSLADGCQPGPFQEFKNRYPDHLVISYINCSARIKAMSDIICTSSNAETIVTSLPQTQKIIFAPDRYLGGYLVKKIGRPMVLWNGSCQVHEQFAAKRVTQLKMEHPSALTLAHPECPENVLVQADFIGSTTAILKYTQSSPANAFIIATEPGIIHQMKKSNPKKLYIPAPAENNCLCNECPHMRLNTLEKVVSCMERLAPRIEMEEKLRLAAKIPLDRMLELSLEIK